MYTEAAQARRRCTGVRKDGQPCTAWALWDDPRQRCVTHAGRGHQGPYLPKDSPDRFYGQLRPRYVPCTCGAYAWPHRPGGGLCRWPDPPEWRRTTPVSTHGEPRVRDALDVRYKRQLRKQDSRRWWAQHKGRPDPYAR